MSRFRSIALFLIMLMSPNICVGASESKPLETVIVMHGLGRTSLSMLPMEWYLEAQGYSVDNWNYDGFQSLTEQLSDQLVQKLTVLNADAGVSRIHIVGHSFGGIIARNTIAKFRPSKLGRVVQLAPPNQGAEIARHAAPYLSWLLKPLVELRPGPFIQSIPRLAGVEIAVIQGSKDFVVRSYESPLAEATETAIVDSSHTFIMDNDDAQELTLSFLRSGKFAISPSLEQRPASP